jgi:hypothetical protein
MIGVSLACKKEVPMIAFAMFCLRVAIAGHDIRSLITHFQHAPLLNHDSTNLENLQYAQIHQTLRPRAEARRRPLIRNAW